MQFYDRLPEQAIQLLKYLADRGSASQKELIDNLDLPLRTIRYSIRRLKEEQFIVSKPDLLDMRSLKYEINQTNMKKIEIILKEYNESLV